MDSYHIQLLSTLEEQSTANKAMPQELEEAVAAEVAAEAELGLASFLVSATSCRRERWTDLALLRTTSTPHRCWAQHECNRDNFCQRCMHFRILVPSQ